MRFLFSFFILLSLSISSQAALYKGPLKKIGNGWGFAWVRTDHGKPVQLGIGLTKAALEGLPTTEHFYEYRFFLPRGITPYKHLALDWNPHGHEPNGVYNIPHFDLHFYLITTGQRQQISCAGSDLANCEKIPLSKYVPAGYVPTPGGVPMMGAHWINPASPEFHGQTFTHTFIYGFYKGHVNFVEPMFSLDFLKSRPDVSMAIPQPASVCRHGYYPQKYKFYTDPAGNVLIYLDGLKWK